MQVGDRTITPGQHQGASMVGSEEIFKVEKGNQLAIRDGILMTQTLFGYSS